MPVAGFLSTDPKNLKFKWLSLRTIHTAIIILGLAVLTILSVIHTLSISPNITKLTTIIFFLSNLYAMICFLLIARKFPYVMKRWLEVEASLPRVKHQEHQYIMTRKIRIVGFSFLMTSLAEHLLSMTKSIYFAQYCKIYNDDTTEAYYHKAAALVFDVFDYSLLRGILTSMFLVTGTFMWNYMDVFIMIISFGLFNLFKQINRILIDVKRKVSFILSINFIL